MQNKRKVLLASSGFVLAFLATISPLAADSLDELTWLVGRWESTSENGSSLEHWTDGGGGMMLGVHRDVLASGRVAFEFLRIEPGDEGVVYYAQPSGRYPATPFRLVESGGNRAVFANPEHDFPKRIVYWLADDGALHARAEGDDGQGPEWRWEKAGP